MRKKIYLPKSMQELQSLGNEKITELWLRYSKSEPILAIRKRIRSLWYEIQCEDFNLQIDQKNITRLNRYAGDPEKHIEKSCKTKYHIRSGTEIEKVYKGRQYKILVRSPEEFIYNSQSYKTLSAVARAICNKKVSGYDFFGLNNKLYEKGIIVGRDERTQSEKSAQHNVHGGEEILLVEDIMDDQKLLGSEIAVDEEAKVCRR